MSTIQLPTRLLLDTHALVWFANDAPELSATARELLADEHSSVYISVVSFWELATLTNVGRIRLEPTLDHWFARIRSSAFRFLDISDAHLLTYAALPQVKDHRDPFDRLLLAQAITENLTILSRDAKFASYPVSVRW